VKSVHKHTESTENFTKPLTSQPRQPTVLLMTSQLDQASFDRRVTEAKKTDGNPGSHAASDDAGKPSASSSAARQQFQADWSCFEKVFAKGL